MSQTAMVEFNDRTGKYDAKFNGELLVSVKNHQWITSTLNKNKRPRELNVTKWEFAVGEGPVKKIISGNGTAFTTPDAPAFQSKFDVNDRFEFISQLVQMVRSKVTPSLIITGEGGIGKTYSVMEELADLEREVDYIEIKGYSTAKGLYRSLFENNGRLIVFDDCDSVLKDVVSLNILKSALDSYGDRWISWNAESNDDLERSFKFTGQIIFISNMPSHKIDQAILSRSMVVDLTMTPEDKIKRMRNIMPNMLPEVPLEMKSQAMNWIEENSEKIKDLNFRTLIKVSKIRQGAPGDWERLADFMTKSE